MFWIFVRGDSNKHPEHMFYEEMRTKQDLFYISICSLRILCNSKFILMATSNRISDIVVTRVHCKYLIGEIVSLNYSRYVTQLMV